MRLFLAVSLFVFTAACGEASVHVNAYTLEECQPSSSYMPKGNQGNGAQNDRCQGTSNGDNCDDLSSGKIDCIGDGNSGQGDDKKHNCVFPQPGCDADGCCDEEVVDEPDAPDAPAPDSPDDGSGPIT
jgi:hypothetical protein